MPEVALGDSSASLPPLQPMQPVKGELPVDDGWGYELKWDGMRLLTHCNNGTTHIRSRSGQDVTSTFPELHQLASKLGTNVVLDGEIVAFDDTRPSFERLQNRIHQQQPSNVLLANIPLVYVIFDMLTFDNQPVYKLDYQNRRRLLADVVEEHPNWKVPTHSENNGQALLALSTKHNLEGVVAKRLTSTYELGKRSSAWIKVKRRQQQEFVVGGWQKGSGSLQNTIGALLLGTWTDQKLQFAGTVGSGLTDEARVHLQHALVSQPASPFTPAPERKPQKQITWTEPNVVVDVEFYSWPMNGKLRQPTYRGLRSDKDPTQVFRETPESG